jgi:hypothetical protein
MKDLKDPGWIKAKGILFLIIGILSSVLLLIECSSWRVAVLLAIAIWCFCRFYYFVFRIFDFKTAALRSTLLRRRRPLLSKV